MVRPRRCVAGAGLRRRWFQVCPSVASGPAEIGIQALWGLRFKMSPTRLAVLNGSGVQGHCSPVLCHRPKKTPARRVSAKVPYGLAPGMASRVSQPVKPAQGPPPGLQGSARAPAHCPVPPMAPATPPA